MRYDVSNGRNEKDFGERGSRWAEDIKTVATSDQQTLLNQFRRRSREGSRHLLLFAGPGTLITLLAFVIAWFFVEPAPPRSFVIAAGPKGGSYYDFACLYADQLQKSGVNVEVRETEGSVENYQLLAADADVDVAIVQGGTAPANKTQQLEAIGSVFFEPVWVFYRSDVSLTLLRELRGKRIHIGAEGSGTALLAKELLRANGINEKTAEFHYLDTRAAGEAIVKGEMDAAFYVMSPKSTLIRRLLGHPQIRLMDFQRHDAYHRLYPFLSTVELPPGVIDLDADLPPEKVHLVAPAANLVATPAFHDAFIPLLLAAASRVHSRGDTLSDAGTFPTLSYTEFPVNVVAEQFFESGPTFMQRHLPFWIASLIDRAKILLIPVLALLLPLLRFAPPAYRWQIRSRIYRWYIVLRRIEQRIGQSSED